MRTALGAFLLTMSGGCALGALFLGVQWKAILIAAACGVAAFVLLAASVALLWVGNRRWLVVLPALGLGLAFLVLSMVTAKCGTTYKGTDAQDRPLQELFVRVFDHELHNEVGPQELMNEKMLQLGVALTEAYIAVGAAAGALLGATVRALTTAKTA
jgi:hypothetical protein